MVEITSNYGQDKIIGIEENLDNMTSSIGALWPPVVASFDRLKGIYTKKINNLSEMYLFMKKLDELDREYLNGKVTRTSIRAIVNKSTIKEASHQFNNSYKNKVEAIIPLEGTQSFFEDDAIIYFGSNHKSRMPLQEEIEKYRSDLEQVLESEPRKPSDSLQRAKKQRYTISILSEFNERMLDQIAELYSRFGWSKEEVREIVTNPNNIMSVAYKNNEIVSAGIAEMAKIPINGEQLRMVEITEAATRIKHARKGLYNAVSTNLFIELTKRSKENNVLGGEVDLVFGECNGNAFGALKTARIQGRTFSVEKAEEFGFENSGMLYQHVPINGALRKTTCNDFFPAFINRRELYKKY